MRDEIKSITEEEIREKEDSAVEKYEEKDKSTKPYRQPKYKPQPQVIRCQKCGSTMNLTKTVQNGVEYWFCRSCIRERARELGRR